MALDNIDRFFLASVRQHPRIAGDIDRAHSFVDFCRGLPDDYDAIELVDHIGLIVARRRSYIARLLEITDVLGSFQRYLRREAKRFERRLH